MSGGRYPWWVAPAAVGAAALLQGLGRTWRVEQEDDPAYLAARSAGERFLYCFWHSRLLPLVFTHRGEGVTMLVSQHRDGELISRVIEKMGFMSARGSSTRGGDHAVRDMIRHARLNRHLALTPDGPRGPAEVLKPGLIYLASRLHRRVVPIGTASRPVWVAKSWDRFRVPHPFARVCVSHGAPIGIPEKLDLAGVAAAERELQLALHAVTHRASARAGEGV